jgi:hypothetical protein
MNVLGLCFDSRDLGRKLSIREYLAELLLTLWDEGESFSGKRPFGNSGWEYDLFVPLIQAGLIKGELDDDGYIVEVAYSAGRSLVSGLIREMCGVPK